MSNNNQSELNIVLDLSVPSFVKNMEAQPVAVLPLNIAETIINQFIDNLSNTLFESIKNQLSISVREANTQEELTAKLVDFIQLREFINNAQERLNTNKANSTMESVCASSQL